MTERPVQSAGPSGTARKVLSAVSLAVVLAVSLSVALLTGRMPPVPLERVQGPQGWEMMTIDGNRNGDRVVFSHAKHSGSYTGECRSCHHLAMPGEDESSCAGCHRDMSSPVSMFNHDAHIAREKSRASCTGCHRGDSSRRNLVPCAACHVSYSGKVDDYSAVRGYRDAMHGHCRRCHVEAFSGTRDRGACGYCHR